MAERAVRVAKDGVWKEVAADWADVVLVCRKCSKKLGGGFGPKGDERLAKALRRGFGGRTGKARRRTLAVIEVGCLDICPKGAIVAMRAADPGRWLVVPKGAGLPDVADRLGLGARDDTSAVPRARDRIGAVP